MPKKRTAFRNRLEALLAGAAGAVLARKTPEAAEAWGRALGRLYRRLDAKRRDLTRKNLARAFPELPPAGIDALAVRAFEHFGGVAAELLHAAGREPGEVLSRLETVGTEIARAASASGRGVFFLTAHLGNWEWAALGTGAIGIPIRVSAPFFGRPASTSSALAKLVDRTEALVVPTTAIRIAPARWRLTYEPPLDVRTLSGEERGVEKLTARLNGILEQMIRRTPEQWLWLHNRWRLD